MKESIKVLIDEAAIAERINELAKEINDKYVGKTITLICVLKGSIFFTVDLSKKLSMPVEFDFMDVSSYGDSDRSSGTIKIDKDLENSINGKHVLLVEDIIDSGHTLSQIVLHLKAQKPASFEICTLLNKPERREVFDVNPEYVGFVIPNEFVVGYGLDYAQRYRNLPYVGVLSFEI